MTGRIILLQDGKQIFVDEEDYESISKDQWRRKKISVMGGRKRFFIENVNVPYQWLHFRILPNEKFKEDRLRLVFGNGDEFDYRKQNLIVVPYCLGKPIQKKVKQTHETSESQTLGILQNRCIITNVPLKLGEKGTEWENKLVSHRDKKCIICGEERYKERYSHCLDVAAIQGWQGWKWVECQE